MRLLSAVVLALLLAGCSGSGSGSSAAADDALVADDASGSGGPALASKPVQMDPVQDTVSFSGTLAATACWFDGSSVSCANVAGSNVLVYQHERKGTFTGGQLTVSFTPDAGTGPYATAFVAEDCPDTCRVVTELGEGTPSAVPGGATGTFEFDLSAATILEDQTLVVRIAPALLTTVASATPTYDIDLSGTLDFSVPLRDAR